MGETTMREREFECGAGLGLKVYPHLPLDKPDIFMASAGSVEAVPFWDADGVIVWGVRLNISYSSPLTKQESDKLQTAIARCWQWIESRRISAGFSREVANETGRGEDYR